MTPSLLAQQAFDGNWYTDVTSFAHHTTWANGAVDAYSTYGVLLFGILLAAAWWAARRTGAVAMAATLSAPVTIGAALAVNAALKSVVAEVRPCRVLPHAFTVESCPAASDFSFPSNHAAMAGAVAMAVLLINRRLGEITAAAALLMAASRVYVGVHYPHDVIVGLALGATIVLIGHVLLRAAALRLLNTLTHTPLRPVLTDKPEPVEPTQEDGGPAGAPSQPCTTEQVRNVG